MRVPILMPQLGESIAEATIKAINVKEGDPVAADQEIIEVETEKAVMEVTSPWQGCLAEISAKVNISYPVGTVLGYLEISEETAKKMGISQEETTSNSSSKTEISQQEKSASTRNNTQELSGEDNQPENAEVTPTIPGLPVPAKAKGATYISPRLRARMQELGLNAADLSGIAGSGSAGRVTVEDFEAFMSALEEKKTTPASSMRIAVADSMRRSWTRPLATVGTPVSLDKLLNHRKSCAPKPGPTLYAVRALALALSENTANAGQLVGNQIVHPDAIDIGFAVEVDDGVLVPVIRDVDKKPLHDLTQQYASLVEAANKRRLPVESSTPPGIATVTNFGSFGIVWATPIPLPEQNLVLGLGHGRQKPQWDNESSSWTPVIEAEMTLSFDHRILDGGAAGRLLWRVSELLQSPENL